VSGDASSYASFSLTVGDDAGVTCHHYGNRTPILVIDFRGCSVSVSTGGLDATEGAVEFARALARKAQEFADDIERLHTARHDGTGDTKATEGKAA
jgi:hypothetical protein